jgi:hypothetical protein
MEKQCKQVLVRACYVVTRLRVRLEPLGVRVISVGPIRTYRYVEATCRLHFRVGSVKIFTGTLIFSIGVVMRVRQLRDNRR